MEQTEPYFVNGQQSADLNAYYEDLERIFTDHDSIEYSMGENSEAVLHYELGRTRDYLCMQAGLDSGRDSYAEITQTLIDCGAMGKGYLYDADGDGSDELFLTFLLQDSGMEQYGAIYTRKDGRVVPIIYEEPICVLAGSPDYGVGVVQDGGINYYAVFRENNTTDIYGGVSSQQWRLYDVTDGSLVTEAALKRQFGTPEDLDAFWAVYGTEDEIPVDYTDAAEFNGAEISPEAYRQWSEALLTVRMVTSGEIFRGAKGNALTLEELLPVLH